MTDEIILLGQIFKDNNVFYKINLLPDDFADPKTRALFKTMCFLSERSIEIDEVAVYKTNQSLNVAWLAEVRDSSPTAANYEFYERRIKDAANKRRLSHISRLISDELAAGKSADEVKEAVETELTNLATAARGWDVKNITDVLVKTMDVIEERFKLQGKLPGITTGFGNLNELLLGFRPRLLYIFGARPSRGKTALMLNMAIAASAVFRVGIINTESANQEMGMRILSSHSSINSQRLASGQIQQNDFARLSHSSGELSKRNVFFYDEPNASLSTVISKCREMRRKDKVDIVFIDYLQNINFTEKNTERENLGVISGRLKQTARQLEIPVVCLAQLRRDAEGGRPSMNDLLGSGKIEQDADVISLIWWQQTNKGDKDQAGNPLPPDYRHWLILDKNRDGMIGDCELHFAKDIVKFTEVENNT
jgi:replicative DNA helicase